MSADWTRALLDVRDLKTYFRTGDGVAKAVDGVSFSVEQGRTLGIVGESGCGKTVSCLSVMRLIACPPGEYAGGQVLFDGVDLLTVPEETMRTIRGNEIAMVFQEPMTSLNPVFTCGDQVMEAVMQHQRVSREAARSRTIETFKLVGIPDPERRVDEYPHQLSGGLRQRVMIAMALSCNARLLICDEPTTALDVTIQAQILNLLKRLQRELATAIILITHDLGVIAEMADTVSVMYAGKVVEAAEVRAIFHQPQHPYTIGLHKAIPRMGVRRERLNQIEGVVPNPLNFPPGCAYHPRCPIADERCRTEEPPLKPVTTGHLSRCWKTGEFAAESLYDRTRLVG